MMPSKNLDYKKPVKKSGEGNGGLEQNSSYEKPIKEGGEEGEEGDDRPLGQSSKSRYLVQEEKKKVQVGNKIVQVAVALTLELNTNGGSSSSSSSTDHQVHSSTSSNATNNNEPSQMSHILPPSFSVITSSESSSTSNNQDGFSSSSRVDNSKIVKKRFLFQKLLNESDTGKFNRLVIPRKYAEKYFPSLKQGDGNEKPQMKLNFSDKYNKTWEMKFEFWKTSKCYVLSTGWKKFVTEYGLKPSYHVVRFYKIEEVSDDNNLFIDFQEAIKLFGTVICKNEDGSNGTQRENGEADHKRKITQTGSTSKRQRK